jgi:multiple sugar transport system substrate-binding protein
MPDVLDLNLELLSTLSAQDQFVPLDDLYKKLGEEQGGWFPSVDAAADTTKVAGGRTGIPFGVTGNMLMRRTDLLKDGGLREGAGNLAGAAQQSEAVTKAPVSGLGLALSNVGDGNMQVSVLHSYGGRIADDEGKTVTINSPETRAYLEWVESAWDKGVFPPGQRHLGRRGGQPGLSRRPGRHSSPIPGQWVLRRRLRIPNSSRRPTTRRFQPGRKA